MSNAEELLNSLTEEDISTTPTVEEHIVIGADRFITVPEPLQRIAVQYDHNVETVTFDCPRYWDEHDLSTLDIYVNYNREDGIKSRSNVKNIVVDETDENIIHFDWTITEEITSVPGKLFFLVCAVRLNEEGEEELHWNSELNNQMYVSTGLEGLESVYERYPDIITDLLTRMDYILVGDGTVLDKSMTLENFAADAKTVGDRFNAVETKLDNEIEETNTEINAINTTLNNLQQQITSNDTDIENINTNINTINTTVQQNDDRYELIFAKKENLGQLYLSSKYNETILSSQSAYNYTTPSLTSSNTQGYIVTILNNPIITDISDIYTMVGGNGNGNLRCPYNSDEGRWTAVVIEFPGYIKPESFSVKGSNLGMRIWASNDGVNYTKIWYGTNIRVNGTYSIECNTFYKFIKFSCANYDSGVGYIYNNIQISGRKIDAASGGNKLLITKKYSNEELNSYEDGLIIKIKTPSTYVNDITTSSTINIYGLGEKNIPNNLEPSSRYTLVYNGTEFEHE